ncbi:MAG: phage terminase large subunit [Prevotellaceae bacterium]|jgi:phage terminase large subunit|nr:phage terminase large subunit [Prevotellaceae bacterium]
MIKIQDVYFPLYTNKDKFIILVTGGRGSGKSFNIAAFIERLSFEKGHIVLFTRYTLTSASISIIPEFNEKIELEGTENYFNITTQDIINNVSGSKILFRGIKTSSGNQTAKLKSIQGITTFVCDEAEEWVSETDYEKIMLSIRQKGIQNRIIIIMNPSDVNHFIYKKYIEKNHETKYFDDIAVQISTHPNVLHIHTSYLDNLEHLGDEFLKIAAETKAQNPEKYAHQFMGQWAQLKEGVIFSNIEIVEDIPYWVKNRWLGLDFGYTHSFTAAAEIALDGKNLYIDEKFYRTKMLTDEIIEEVKKYKHLKTISESADPRLVQEIYNAGIDIHPVKKYAGSNEAGVNAMLELNIKITKRSQNAKYEFQNLVWAKDKEGNKLNVPEKTIQTKDHIFDLTKYVVLSEIVGYDEGIQDLEGYF